MITILILAGCFHFPRCISLTNVYRCVPTGGHSNAHNKPHRDNRNKLWDVPTIQGCNRSGSGSGGMAAEAATAGSSGAAAGTAGHKLLRGRAGHTHGLTMACRDDRRQAWKTCARQQVQAGRGQVSCAPGCVWACASVGKETRVSAGCCRFREEGQRRQKSKTLIMLRWQQEFFSWRPPFERRVFR